MKVFYIPIEPYKTRYTADWIQQFEREFQRNNVDYETILGDTFSNNVTAGGVLDACGTHVYKFTQLQKLITKINFNEVHNGDVLFFADLWFPGLESLFYIRNMTGIQFKICGIFHAGTYDPHDFTCRNNMRSWGKWLEASWFSEIDKIFVATEFHKGLLLRGSIGGCCPSKIFVTGLPFYGNELREKYLTTKEDIVVFPHRLDKEKHPELFDSFVDRVVNLGFNVKAIKTIDETSSREEYFSILGKSKIMLSFAEQETFGYSTLESMALDNIVIVPNELSYVETVPRKYRYNTLDEAFNRLVYSLQHYQAPDYDECFIKWEKSIPNMLALL